MYHGVFNIKLSCKYIQNIDLEYTKAILTVIHLCLLHKYENYFSMRDITYKASAEKSAATENSVNDELFSSLFSGPNTEGATDTEVHKTEADAETDAEANVVYIMGLSILSCLANIFKTPT